MIRVLFGPDVKDYQALEKELAETKRMYDVSEEKRAAAEHGWRTARAEREDLAQYCDGLHEQLRGARREVEAMHRRWNQAVGCGLVPDDLATVPVQVAGSLYEGAES